MHTHAHTLTHTFMALKVNHAADLLRHSFQIHLFEYLNENFSMTISVYFFAVFDLCT